jgi:exosortase/archaeosortase family protein
LAEEERGLKSKYPNSSTLILVFLASLVFFYVLPPLLLGISYIDELFSSLGSYNAWLHQIILSALGIKASTSSNLLFLPSGSVVEYSPYCFGFLTLAAFAILAFIVPSLQLIDRLKWIAGAFFLISIANQFRIISELLIASRRPDLLSTADLFSYPFLPLLGLFIWYRGLKNREHIFSSGEDRFASG